MPGDDHQASPPASIPSDRPKNRSPRRQNLHTTAAESQNPRRQRYRTPIYEKSRLSIADHEVADLIQGLVGKGKIIPDADGGNTRPVKIGGKQIRHYVFAPAFLRKKPKPKTKNVAKPTRRSQARRRKAANGRR